MVQVDGLTCFSPNGFYYKRSFVISPTRKSMIASKKWPSEISPPPKRNYLLLLQQDDYFCQVQLDVLHLNYSCIVLGFYIDFKESFKLEGRAI